MNKDALLATIIGFGIGLVITGALLLGPTLSKSFPTFSLPKISFPTFNQQTPQPTPQTQPKELTVAITSPLPEAIEPNDTVLVSGTTLPDALVLVSGESDEDVVKTNGDGAYAGKVALLEGENTIIVTAYKDEKNVSHAVTVFYTPEEF